MNGDLHTRNHILRHGDGLTAYMPICPPLIGNMAAGPDAKPMLMAKCLNICLRELKLASCEGRLVRMHDGRTLQLVRACPGNVHP